MKRSVDARQVLAGHDISCHNAVTATVMITADAREQFDHLPMAIKGRVQAVVGRLVDWPEVSGAKALRREFKGAFRIRTGDYRILFTVDAAADRVTVFRIDNRRDVYE